MTHLQYPRAFRVYNNREKQLSIAVYSLSNTSKQVLVVEPVIGAQPNILHGNNSLFSEKGAVVREIILY